MNEVFIDIRKENEYIRKYFTSDLVSLDQLLNVIEDLDSENGYIKEQLEEYRKSDDEKYDEYLWKLADEQYERNRIGE